MKFLNLVSRTLSMVGVILVIPMMLLIIADVFLRAVFNSPITGTAEIACLMLICMSMGMAWPALEEKHLKIEFIMNLFPPRIQSFVDSITLIGGMFIVIIMAWRNLISALWRNKIDEVSSVLLPIPLFPFHLVLVIGLAAMFLAMIPVEIKKIKEVLKNES